MKTFLKHYWIFVIWVLFVLWTYFYFNPNQDIHYLDADLTVFTKNFPIGMIVAGIVLILILYLISFRALPGGKSRAIFLVNIILIVGFSFFFLKDFIKASYLYVNRQATRSEMKRNYIAETLFGDTSQHRHIHFVEVDSRQSAMNDAAIRRAYPATIHPNDTIQLTFRKGLLGLYYLK
jgi:hypothetical protein